MNYLEDIRYGYCFKCLGYRVFLMILDKFVIKERVVLIKIYF